VRSLVGCVDYGSGSYRLRAAEIDARVRRLPKRPGPGRRRRSRDSVTITTWNLKNLFDLVDQPGKDDIGTGGARNAQALEVQLSTLAESIRHQLRTPEILVVQEVENTAVLRTLADRVNAAAGTAYDAVSIESSDRRGIEVGLFWDTERATLVDAFQLSGPEVEAAFGRSSPSPGREPLVGEFRIGGDLLTLVGIHLKSKSGDDPIFGVNRPFRRPTEAQRKLQARAVRSFVDAVLDEDPEALMMVLGDLNDFEFPEPGEGADHPAGILEGLGGRLRLTNLVRLERPGSRFSFVFDGNSQVLDHVFVSPALLERLRGARFLHFNAGFPGALGDDPGTTLRSSDHDPLSRWSTGGTVPRRTVRERPPASATGASTARAEVRRGTVPPAPALSPQPPSPKISAQEAEVP
jgi:predicted extracellular nuclease